MQLCMLVFLVEEANEKGLRGLQLSTSSLLEVHISEVSIQKGKVKPFDNDGCPSTTVGPSSINYYAVVKYIIHNSGDDFSPAFAYKGEADCHKPAVLNFLYLEGLVPSVKLSKYATCVVDDEFAAGQDTCASSSSNSMTIRSGKSYGRTTAAFVKFTIEDSDFATLVNAAAATKLDLKLSVNSLISPAVSAEVSVLKGSELGSVDWFSPEVFPAPVMLYSAPTQTQTPTLTPSTMISTLPPTTTSMVVINNLIDQEYYGQYLVYTLNLAEVQLFNNGVQIPRELLTVTLSSTYSIYQASLCNDGLTDNFCHSDPLDPNPTLTIVSPVVFDKVVVYNRVGYQNRIRGATITATVSGQSKATTFPDSPGAALTYLFSSSSSGLQLYIPPV